MVLAIVIVALGFKYLKYFGVFHKFSLALWIYN